MTVNVSSSNLAPGIPLSLDPPSASDFQRAQDQSDVIHLHGAGHIQATVLDMADLVTKVQRARSEGDDNE
jgi:hypothetical protein